MEKKTPGIRKVFWVGLAVITVTTIRQFWLYDCWAKAFEEVTPNMLKADVVKLFGPPMRIEKPYYSEPTWNDAPLGKAYGDCVEEYDYDAPIPIPWGEGWVIGFDKNGRAVRHSHIVSP